MPLNMFQRFLFCASHTKQRNRNAESRKIAITDWKSLAALLINSTADNEVIETFADKFLSFDLRYNANHALFRSEDGAVIRFLSLARLRFELYLW